MARESFFQKFVALFRRKKSIFKAVALFAVIFYFLLLFVANIVYFKYDKRELLLLPKVNFGIDIVGGNQLTIAVDTSEIVGETIDNTKEFLKTFCKEKNTDCSISNKNVDGDYVVSVKFLLKEENVGKKTGKKFSKQIIRDIRNAFNNFSVNVVKNEEKELSLDIVIKEEAVKKLIADTTDKAISILKNRIDGVGVKEIAVQRYGMDKIVILVPKSVDVNGIKSIINTTAKLEFHLMDREHIFYYKPTEIAKKHKLLPSYKGDQKIYYLVEEKSVLSGDSIASVQPNIDGINNAINFRMNASGTKKFAEITTANRGRLLAILLDDKVLMAPMINTAILNGAGSITGQFTADEVVNLSVLLRSGSLPAKVSIINEKHLSSVFDKNILSRVSYISILLLFVVALLLFARYRILGFVAVLALTLNCLFTFGIISIFGFTLTLPGIAGFVLMLGMATDANILIYEKMKDVAKKGIKYKESIIKNGFSRAIGTILDANITTIIAGIALFSFGGSFIKGFSITLIFGILCCVFTSVNITKMVINWIYRNKNYLSV